MSVSLVFPSTHKSTVWRGQSVGYLRRYCLPHDGFEHKTGGDTLVCVLSSPSFSNLSIKIALTYSKGNKYMDSFTRQNTGQTLTFI